MATRRRKRKTDPVNLLIRRMTGTGIVVVIGAVILGIYAVSWVGDSMAFTSAMRREKLKQEQLITQDKLNEVQEAQKRRENWTRFQEDVTPVFYFLLIAVSGCGVLYFFSMVQRSQIANDKERRSRNEDGSWPWIEIDENTMLDPNTDTFYRWNGVQWIAQPSQYTPQKIYLDHQKQMYAGRDPNARMTSQERKLLEGQGVFNPNNIQIETYADNSELLQIEATAHKPDTVSEFIEGSEMDSLLVGYDKESPKTLALDMVNEHMHVIVAGKSGHGKSWLIQLISATLNSEDANVSLFIHYSKGLMDYTPMVDMGAMDGHEIDEVGFLYCAQLVEKFVTVRNRHVKNAGAKNANDYEQKTGKRLQPYVFIFEELLAMATSVRGDKSRKTTFESALHSLASVMTVARTCSVHIIMSMQNVNSDIFDKDVRANVSVLHFKGDHNASKSLQSSTVVSSLGKGEFIALDSPRDENNLDRVWVVPYSEREEETIQDRFDPQRGKSMFELLGAELPPMPGLSEFDDQNTVQKTSLTSFRSEKPVFTNSVQTQENQFKTQKNSVQTRENSLETVFELTDLDWQNIRNMKPAKTRQAYLRDNFPRIGEVLTEQTEVDYLLAAYNGLDYKSDMCFMLYGRKDGITFEWLNNAIDNYLVFEE